MTVGSLFAGIGGFDLGFERAGFSTSWQVEINPFCREILAEHWPLVRRLDDVQRVHEYDGNDAGPCSYCVEPVDVLCGGFPCQDISSAGRRAGIHGSRSGLWREFHRLIRVLRPRWAVVENSSNLLADGYGMDVVLGQLAAIGYDAEWDCLPVSAFGGPHERERVFIVAYPRQAERRSRDSAHGGTERTHDHDRGPQGRQATQGAVVAKERAGAVPDADGAGFERPCVSVQQPRADAGNADVGRHRAVTADAHRAGPPYVFGREAHASLARFRATSCDPWWSTEPAVVRVVHGVSERVVRRRERHTAQIGALGNAVVPQITEWIARRILEAEAGND